MSAVRKRWQRLLNDDEALLKLKWASAFPAFVCFFWGVHAYDSFSSTGQVDRNQVLQMLLALGLLASYVVTYQLVKRHRNKT